jgi:hypothetical protein
MQAASSGKNTITFLSRLAVAGAFTVAVLGFAAAPDLRAETPAAVFSSFMMLQEPGPASTP